MDGEQEEKDHGNLRAPSGEISRGAGGSPVGNWGRAKSTFCINSMYDMIILSCFSLA